MSPLAKLAGTRVLTRSASGALDGNFSKARASQTPFRKTLAEKGVSVRSANPISWALLHDSSELREQLGLPHKEPIWAQEVEETPKPVHAGSPKHQERSRSVTSPAGEKVVKADTADPQARRPTRRSGSKATTQ